MGVEWGGGGGGFSIAGRGCLRVAAKLAAHLALLIPTLAIVVLGCRARRVRLERGTASASEGECECEETSKRECGDADTRT